MTDSSFTLGVLTLVFCIFSSACLADNTVVSEDEDDDGKSWFAAPGLYYSDYLDLAIGAGAYISGFRQPQESFFVSAYTSKSGSRGLWFYSYQSQLLERLFLDSSLHWGWRHDVKVFRDGNPNFSDEVAGSNDSSNKNYVESTGEDAYFNLKFYYVLPWGDGESSGIHEFHTYKGQLVKETAAGGSFFNPKRSGRFFIGTELFAHRQRFDDQYNSSYNKHSSGVRISAQYDNRNWSAQPSMGSNHKLTLSRDSGKFDSSGSWTKIELDMSKYWPLGPSSWAKDRVLAMNFYSADVTSWSSGGRPPEFEQPSLGGYDRLRAMPYRRYHDRSAIYYGLEHRYTFKHNPINLLPLPDFVPHFDLQWATFAELGRVNKRYDLIELHRDMQWSAGVGLRANLQGSVGRMDVAKSDHSWGLYLSAAYPW
ncbi:BamA/TamA family outer membrane protein [Agaribacterium haliotis]|uniref:BamA/TamA family outer membrane protein n=1 Tax=Agaribacterium haliotis TaxID=2013869 RepID=UPI000BB596CB|nr:BamA/TamA family outer membrane protein [Agaribacterium haliotis]